jgi:hypothetical protein
MSRAGVPSANVKVAVVLDERGEGFTRTVNRGLALAWGDVCLLNEDAEPVTEGWLRTLTEEMRRREELRVWFAGPSGPCRTAPQNGGRVGDQRRPRGVKHLAGFCLLIKREALDALGGLDERFVHYGSDVELQWRAWREYGARSLWVPGVYCKHELHPPRRTDWYERDNRLLMEV